MAQPIQVFNTNDPSNTYSVLDNTPQPAFPGTLNAGTLLGYDTIAGPAPVYGGANNQGANAYKNGTMPDFFIAGKSFTCSTAVIPTPNIVSYKLPS